MKYIILIFFFLLAGCGKKDGKSSHNEAAISIQEMQEDVVGNYRVVLRPINSRIYGAIATGSGKIESENNALKVNLVMDWTTNTSHLQNIFAGTRCPEPQDDKNGDSFVDIVEAQSIMGNILIPLDGDLNTQLKGFGNNPSGPSYTYMKTADLTQLLNDLKASDENPSDSITKLPSNAGFQLEGKVILIQGVRDGIQLPESVQTIQGWSKNQSLPIACGVIQKVN